ncbi:MAG: hypothetical protein AAFV53_19470 [Myxococcota bacterium]
MSDDRQSELSRLFEETSARWAVDPLDPKRFELWWRDRILATINHASTKIRANARFVGATTDWAIDSDTSDLDEERIETAKQWCLEQLGPATFQRLLRYEQVLSLEADQAAEVLMALAQGDTWLLEWLVSDARKVPELSESYRTLSDEYEQALTAQRNQAVSTEPEQRRNVGKEDPLAKALGVDALSQIEDPATRAFFKSLNR